MDIKIKVLSVLFIILCISASHAQVAYTFENGVPAQWTSSGTGSLTTSSEHYKEGIMSLCWKATGVTTLTVSITSLTISGTNSAFMQIYLPVITNDTLVVQFKNNATVVRQAKYLCNYKGWHDFNRAYKEYSSTASTTINSVVITLRPVSLTLQRTLYFDDVNLSRTTDDTRYVGCQWTLDYKYMTASDSTCLKYYHNPVDLPTNTPTSSQLTDLNTLRNTAALQRTPRAGTSAQLTEAQSFVASLNITHNTDGSVKGNIINASADSLTIRTFDNVANYANYAEWLAADMLANPSDQVKYNTFHDYLAHLLDQGLSNGANFELPLNNYTPAQTIPLAFLNIIPACTAGEKVEIVKLLEWMTFYGKMYNPSTTYLSDLLSDDIYLYSTYRLSLTLIQPDDATCVRDLLAYKRFLERNSEYSPGNLDFMKPDGTSFHHWTQYNGYMYAYKTFIANLSSLSGTQFQIATANYQQLKKAAISLYIMGTRDAGDNRYIGNPLCGRHPFSAGVPVSTWDFGVLMNVGKSILGSQDNELANAYNYFFKSTKFKGFTPQSYDGFYQFNYGNLGIYRKNNWVVTMKAPNKYNAAGETDNNQGRFTRYQAYGSLDIIYGNPTSVANKQYSGYLPSETLSGGWDWNCQPGTTVVRYNDWQTMMPSGSVSDVYYQRTKTTNFSGSVSMDSCGVFATDFDQGDIFWHLSYSPTNLAFKKTMFAINGYIFSLGSNITSSGTFNSGNNMRTQTNLFQTVYFPSVSGNLVVNGVVQNFPYSLRTISTADNWLITPAGTGYFIPKGNDSIYVQYGDQTTPLSSGADYAAPITTVTAAKAYLAHGLNPTNSSYVFVAIPAATPGQMTNLATQMANGGGSIYQVQAQTNQVHAILYKPGNITAYSFFAATSGLTFGIVKSSSAPALLIEKNNTELGTHDFVASDPSLGAVTDPVYVFMATPTTTVFTLAGQWNLKSAVAGVSVLSSTATETQIQVTFNQGERQVFSVCSITTSLSELKRNPHPIEYKDGNDIRIYFDNDLDVSEVGIDFVQTNGILKDSRKYKLTSNVLVIHNPPIVKGVNIIGLTYNNRRQYIKLVY